MFTSMYEVDVPYAPTKMEIFEGLEIAQPNLVIDLGCGDGRVLEWFKKKFPACTVKGYEKFCELALIALDKFNETTYGTSIFIDDMFTADISEADVVFIYWIPEMVERFEKEMLPKMKTGSIVISNTFRLSIPATATHNTLFIYQR